ncbi:MAG TPA: cytochrome c [Candidatus Angelobacter sp.]|nr:cytochrome c [Candidatus Angelobacter sp.]
MSFKGNILACLAVLILGGVLCAAGQEQTKLTNSSVSSASTDTASATAIGPSKAVHEVAYSRYEGEKRYRANCGRCHMAPHKFPPRMMATILRHMRVRATLTDEDMRYVLRYMTE